MGYLVIEGSIILPFISDFNNLDQKLHLLVIGLKIKHLWKSCKFLSNQEHSLGSIEIKIRFHRQKMRTLNSFRGVELFLIFSKGLNSGFIWHLHIKDCSALLSTSHAG